MRRTFQILALLLIVVGAIFAAQGADLLGGSMMTGDRRWLIIGIIMFVAGLLLAQFTLLRRR